MPDDRNGVISDSIAVDSALRNEASIRPAQIKPAIMQTPLSPARIRDLE